MTIMSKLAQIVDLNCRQPQLLGSTRYAVIQRPAKEVRKDSYNVGLHRESETFTAEYRFLPRAPLRTLCLALSSWFVRLFPLFFRRRWRIHFQQAFGQRHVHLLLLQVHAIEIRFRERH